MFLAISPLHDGKPKRMTSAQRKNPQSGFSEKLMQFKKIESNYVGKEVSDQSQYYLHTMKKLYASRLPVHKRSIGHYLKHKTPQLPQPVVKPAPRRDAVASFTEKLINPYNQKEPYRRPLNAQLHQDAYQDKESIELAASAKEQAIRFHPAPEHESTLSKRSSRRSKNESMESQNMQQSESFEQDPYLQGESGAPLSHQVQSLRRSASNLEIRIQAKSFKQVLNGRPADARMQPRAVAGESTAIKVIQSGVLERANRKESC